VSWQNLGSPPGGRRRTNTVPGGAREVRPGGTGGANYRAKYGLLYAEATTTRGLPKDPAQRALFLNILRDANRQLAIELQDLTVEKLQEGRIDSREGVSTNRLAMSITDPRNRRYNAFAFGVGVMDFLDNRSPARQYWRQIEAGSSVHVGRRIFGVWGASFSGRYGTFHPGASPKYGPYPLAGPGYSRHGANRAGRLMPMSRKTAYAYLRGEGMTPAGARRMTRRIDTIIRNRIVAQRYYQRAWREFNGRTRGREALIRALRESGITGG
jgi:hypothetical protein